MDKLKLHSPDITQENIAKIAELFPGCVTEAVEQDGKAVLAVDFDQLRQERTLDQTVKSSDTISLAGKV